MGLAVKTEVYGNTAIMNVVPQLRLETFANSDFRLTDRGTKAVFTVRTPPDADTTTVNPKTGPANVVEPEETTVEIDLNLYHDSVMPVTIEGSLYGVVNDDLNNAVRDQAIKARRDRNALAKAAYINEIPDNDATAYTWGSQNSKTYTKVSTGTETVGGHSLVYNGTDTTSEAALVSVAAGETFSDPKWFDKFYGQLVDNGATPIINLGGQDMFECTMPTNVWALLKDNSDVQDDMRHYPWNGGRATMANGVTVYRGFILNIVPEEQLKKPGLGAAGIDIFSVLFHGRNYFAVAGREASSLPSQDLGGKQPLMRLPVDRFTEIRATPQGDAFGSNVNVVPMSYIGYGILEPEEGIKFNVAGV